MFDRLEDREKTARINLFIGRFLPFLPTNNTRYQPAGENRLNGLI